MITIEGIAGLTQLEGQHIGHSPWLVVEQPQVDGFAKFTLDEQWIHVDTERAATGPFGTTIAHGFLTLSLVQSFYVQMFEVVDTSLTINYGLNKVRFPQPVPVGSSIRLGVEIAEVREIRGGVEAVLRSTVEIEGETKPAMVADVVLRYYA